MPASYVLRATCSILHLGIREGDLVSWDASGHATVTRPIAVTSGALAGFVADGVLTPVRPAADAAWVATAIRAAR